MAHTHTSLRGKLAPTISLLDHNGNRYNIAPGENGGLPIALFFYPKSGSYGCTKEACQFRDAIAEKDIWAKDKVLVIGVSQDPVDKQKAFVEKQKLTYPILSDENGDARKAYGVGKAIFGLTDARVTFMIDGKGIIRDSLDNSVNFGAHSKFVSTWLKRLANETTQVDLMLDPPSSRGASPVPAPLAVADTLPSAAELPELDVPTSTTESISTPTPASDTAEPAESPATTVATAPAPTTSEEIPVQPTDAVVPDSHAPEAPAATETLAPEVHVEESATATTTAAEAVPDSAPEGLSSGVIHEF